jgi:hypothetical protein
MSPGLSTDQEYPDLVATRLMASLERLMGLHASATNDTIILALLDLLQGVLLLHPPSRSIFDSHESMNALLDLLDTTCNPPAIQTQALLLLVTALLDSPANTRTFEQVDGLLTITSLFKSRDTTQDVKMRTLEFLYFYLMPETPPHASASLPGIASNSPAALQRSPSKLPSHLIAHARTHSGDSERMTVDGDDTDGVSSTRSTEEKQRLLSRYLNNVAELVRDLKDHYR